MAKQYGILVDRWIIKPIQKMLLSWSEPHPEQPPEEGVQALHMQKGLGVLLMNTEY